MFKKSFVKFCCTFALALALTGFGLTSAPRAAMAQACEVNRDVNIAGMAWQTNETIANIVATILDEGYGCESEFVPGESLAMIIALARGDIDIHMEIWANSAPDDWHQGIADGSITTFDTPTYSNASEGWWIPRYTQERFPDLKSVSDLAKYKDKFKDPEDPDKGRLISCKPGWVCEPVNENLLKAFGLDNDYNAVLPGSDAALQAEVLSAVKRKRDILTYYWTPTVLIGKADLVPLTMPPFDAKKHKCNQDPDCKNPGASAFPATVIKKGMPSSFAKDAPMIADFISKVSIDSETVSNVLFWADETKAEPEDAAEYFLKNFPDKWKNWVPYGIRSKVVASLE